MLTYSQKKLAIDTNGKLTVQEYAKLRQEKGYQLISNFDTISKNPLLVYAATFKNNKFGIIDDYGKEIIKNEYENIVGIHSTNSPLTAFHDHFFLKKDQLWAISDHSGKIITPFKYEMLYYEEYENSEIFDSSKEWKPPINMDSIFKAKLNGAYMYLNTKGEKIEHSQRSNRLQFEEKTEDPSNFGIPKELGTAKPLTGNLYLITTKKEKPLQGIYDKSLKKMIIPPDFNYVVLHQAMFFSANKDEGTYAYDLHGKLISREIMAFYSDGGSDKIPVIIAHNKNQKSAVFSKDWKALTEFIYDRISPSNHFIKAVIEGKNQQPQEDYLTLEGKKIKINTEYDRLIYQTNEYDRKTESFLFLLKKGKYALVNNQGKLISDFVYESIFPECFASHGEFSFDPGFHGTGSPNQYIYFKKEGKAGIMDNDYNIILNNEYDIILKSDVDNYVYICKKTASGSYKWGVYNVKQKKEIITPQFEREIRNTSDFFTVFKNGKYGLYDTTGKEILPPEYNREVRVNTFFKGLSSLCQEYDIPAGYVDSFGNMVNLNLQTSK